MSNEKEYIPTTAIEEVVIGKDSESALAKSIPEGEAFPRLTMDDVAEGFVTLKIAKARLGLKHLMYVRRLVKEAKLEGIKVKVPGGSRWLVTIDSIGGYKAKRIRRGTKRNYILRIDPKQEEALRKLLAENDIEYSLELAYEGKTKEKKPGEDIWAKVIDSLEA